MFTARKMIDSGSLWLLAVCVLPLCLATPCAAAPSADLAARSGRPLPASNELATDLPDIFIPKPPPPPPILLATDLPDIFIPKPPPPPPPARG
jgi:hypothetical protein